MAGGKLASKAERTSTFVLSRLHEEREAGKITRKRESQQE